MSNKRHTIDEIEKRVRSVLAGTSVRYGNFIQYRNKKRALDVCSKLKERGINCSYERFSQNAHNVVFTDIK